MASGKKIKPSHKVPECLGAFIITNMIGKTFSIVLPVVQAFFVLPVLAETPSLPGMFFPEKPPSISTHHYVSDYFSFVGRDAQGRVAFALDTNRGRDGEQWQAEHFVVMHDERKGWVKLEGNGIYDNVDHELFTIPDSPAFHFEGDTDSGILVRSAPNDLKLFILPLTERAGRKQDGGRHWLGTAQATLQWRGRVVEGRVIYEYLSKPDFNRLTRTYWGLWNHFQGFYLSAAGIGDYYLHQSEGEMMVGLTGKQEAFVVLDEQAWALAEVNLATVTRSFALGFYRWPVQWKLDWKNEAGSATLRLDTVDFKRVANWVTGGFAMSMVQGTLYYMGKSYPLYGLAELLM